MSIGACAFWGDWGTDVQIWGRVRRLGDQCAGRGHVHRRGGSCSSLERCVLGEEDCGPGGGGGLGETGEVDAGVLAQIGRCV